MKATVTLYIGKGRVGDLEAKQVNIIDNGEDGMMITITWKDGKTTSYEVGKVVETS